MLLGLNNLIYLTTGLLGPVILKEEPKIVVAWRKSLEARVLGHSRCRPFNREQGTDTFSKPVLVRPATCAIFDPTHKSL